MKKNLSIFSFGAVVYGLIEILWRGKTHWSMLITGGACFLSLYKLFIPFKNIPVFKKCLMGSFVITAYEFVAGCIFNLWLKLKVWDYSKMPFNIKGQICPFYTFLWGLLTIPISFVCKELE